MRRDLRVVHRCDTAGARMRQSRQHRKEISMTLRKPLVAAMAAVALLSAAGCSVMRDQQTVGTYIDDSVPTTRVKAKFAEDKLVSAMALSVETFKGVVQLSGLAKTNEERNMAERLARETSGVIGVKNDIRVAG
jgi:osmotically-inducible protein OsmY